MNEVNKQMSQGYSNESISAHAFASKKRLENRITAQK